MMETVYSELKVGNLFEVGRMFPLAVMHTPNLDIQNTIETKIFCLNCYQIKKLRIYRLIEIEIFCLHCNT